MQHLSRLYSNQENQVCRLYHALYVLKKASHASMILFFYYYYYYFMQSPYVSVLCIQCNQGILLLLLYVHDMVVTRNNIDGMRDINVIYTSVIRYICV